MISRDLHVSAYSFQTESKRTYPTFRQISSTKRTKVVIIHHCISKKWTN